MEHATQDVRFKCTNNTCNFENYIAGYCPSCDKGYLRKVCECKSGNYAADCCEPDLDKKEKEQMEKMKAEFLKETQVEIEQDIQAEKKKEEEEEKLIEENKEAE